jgi:phage shock protein A
MLQVKTQVAIAIADQHVLDKKLRECEENEKQWMRRAEMALDKKDDNLARAAVERSMSYQAMSGSFRQQVEDQKTQVENLKTALLKLQQKLEEARAKSATLIAEHRRSRAAERAGCAGAKVNGDTKAAAFDRMKEKVRHSEATAAAHTELAADDVEEQFARLEKEDEINRLLEELKSKRKAG